MNPHPLYNEYILLKIFKKIVWGSFKTKRHYSLQQLKKTKQNALGRRI
jgi:hypothetical protein